jgi:Integrase core domain
MFFLRFHTNNSPMIVKLGLCAERCLFAGAIRDWMEQRQIKTLSIRPGSPWEQAYIERFHDKFRDECLNREVFATLAEARIIVESWRKEYNHSRPHSALGYLTPQEFAIHRSSRMRQYQRPARKTSHRLWSRAAAMRDLPTIAFLRAVALLHELASTTPAVIW